MDFLDIVTVASDGLKERKFRFALNLLGILIGCAAVTGLISITQGLGDEIGSQLEMFGPNNIMILPGDISQGGPVGGGKFYWRDVNTIEKVPHIDLVAPIMGTELATYQSRGDMYFCYVYGSTPEYFWIFQNFELAEGRELLQADTASVVIGHNVAQPDDEKDPLYEVGDRIKLTVRVNKEDKEMSFRIVGILKKVGGTFGSEDDQSVVMPYRVFQQLFEIGGEFSFVAVTVDDPENLEDVTTRLEDKLGDISTLTYETIQETVGQVLGTVEAVLGGIAAISLLVAGVGIINTMTISVMERTREIGILKAVGSKSRDILLIFISEAVLTGFIGGILGGLFGFLLSRVVGDYINLPVTNSIELLIGITFFAIMTAVLSGLYPAWRASNLHPVEALRYE